MSVIIKSSIPRFFTFKNPLLFILFLSLIFLLIGPINLLADHTTELIWTAPGDDLNVGQAYRYDIRYSSVPIGSDTANWWNFASKINSVPHPSPAGFKDSCIIPDLPTKYYLYIAIRTADEANNWSDISNIAEIPPSLCIDYNQDNGINILDAVYLLNCLYKDGPPLPTGTISDADNSGKTNILDVMFIINFSLMDGPGPDCGE